jgi:tonB-dependent receptor
MVYAQYATAADPASGNLASAYFSTLSDNTKLTTGRQLEIGSKLGFLDGRGNATVALFDIERKNIATSDPQKPRERLLIGKQRARGVELKAGLQLTRQWSVQGNATYTDAEYRNFYQGGVSLAGKAPTNTPKTIANLWSTYALTPNLSVNATLRHVSRLYANAQNTAYWPAATLVDLGLEYRINRQMTLNAHLDNVADKVYAEDVDDRLAVLGDPRTVFVSLKMQF